MLGPAMELCTFQQLPTTVHAWRKEKSQAWGGRWLGNPSGAGFVLPGDGGGCQELQEILEVSGRPLCLSPTPPLS